MAASETSIKSNQGGIMPNNNILRIRFSEIEHSGDLATCIQDLCASGATVIDSRIDPDAEEAIVDVSVTAYMDFRLRFEKMDSADFCESIGWIKRGDGHATV